MKIKLESLFYILEIGAWDRQKNLTSHATVPIKRMQPPYSRMKVDKERTTNHYHYPALCEYQLVEPGEGG
jgi:hypothetical protein